MKPRTLSESDSSGSCRLVIVFVVALAGLYFGYECQAQIPQVLDLRNPGAGVTRIIPDWGPGTERPPQFIGDVDHDGFDDFAFVQGNTGTVPPPYSIIIYGSPDFPSSSQLDSLRQTRLIHGNGFTGISAWRSPFPFAPAGDLDRDGYADFFLGSASTDWQGIVDTGLVLLIFGGPNYPKAMELENLGSYGVRSLKILSTEERLSAGQVVIQAGDLNGDGLLD